MTRRMLIDAGHREETRVVVTEGKDLKEFDVESATRSQLKGNIYLAKVTRVEPALQAAFIEYGGNRHGFLAYNDIHFDYFQIPVADREELAAEQARLIERAVRDEEDAGADDEAEAPAGTEGAEDGESPAAEDGDAERAGAATGEQRRRRRRSRRNDDVEEWQDTARHAAIHQRDYRIQEVIKRRQILLVQVVKEERGTKGAALTTYLSIAGRYGVLMPNTPRGGGISRKISDDQQRKRLKDIARDLEVPDGMGVIIRTAGQGRTKAEIRRDLASLLKQWESIRQKTLEASAPSMIYEDGNIVKRAIRDLYTKDTEEVQVEGEQAYKTAKDYMKLLMPSHASRVKLYKNHTPILFHYDVESRLDVMHGPVVQLKSGGYIVISPTEALVAIDVNSGRSTKERNIEDTALKTNLEAAEEIGRQIRLRDLAGLIVIDFIDMDEQRNEKAVERRLKDAVKLDRARIRIGRISGFGLLEFSRQRLRPSLSETLSEACPSCGGSGQQRSTESTALHVLRGLESEGLAGRASAVRVAVPTDVALYILNQKRQALLDCETRYDMRAAIERDDDLVAPEFRLETVASREPAKEDEPAAAGQRRGAAPADPPEEAGAEEAAGKRRRRRRRRKTAENGDAAPEQALAEEAAASTQEETTEEETGERGVRAGRGGGNGAEDGRGRARTRGGRRGGRRRARRDGETVQTPGEAPEGEREPTREARPAPDDDAPVVARDGTPAADEADTAPGGIGDAGALDPAPRLAVPETTAPAETADESAAVAALASPPKAPRRGWWNRLTGD